MGNSASLPAAATMYDFTDPAKVYAAQAIARTLHPTSSVPGSHFERMVTIFLENQDFDIADGDPSIQYLASLGVRLDNYWAIAHPSRPNYVAALGADTHGVWFDESTTISTDVETMIDVLEAGNVSWSIYGEDAPFSGFQADWVNQETGANMYVEKHNPMMSYLSARGDVNRLAKSKNLTMFYEELASGTLPQWIWITPNMTSDGHDSSITVAGEWSRSFLDPLLANDNFNIDRTLIVLTWDECENYLAENRVLAILLGSAVSDVLINTTDSTEFSHYSLSKTAQVNWNLGSLDRNDVDATSLTTVLS